MKPYPLERPSNGKRIPKGILSGGHNQKEEMETTLFHLQYGMRIADFFKHIWAKVTGSSRSEEKQEEQAQAAEAGVSEASA